MPIAARPMWLAGLAGAAVLAVSGWGAYRADLFSTPPPPMRPPDRAMAEAAKAQVEQALINSRSTMFSTAPLSSVRLLQSAPEPVLSENFRHLIVLPSEAPRDESQIDPSRLRALMDRGVITFAYAADDEQRQQGAELIQTAALLGFLQARNLLVRNYPHSEHVRRAVPAPDIIRYATAVFMAPDVKDSQALFQALATHFDDNGQSELFLVQLIVSLRGDTRPQLNHRIDTLFELLTRVRGACPALTRILGTDPTAGECSNAEAQALRRLIATSKPVDREEESKRRGLALINRIGPRDIR